MALAPNTLASLSWPTCSVILEHNGVQGFHPVRSSKLLGFSSVGPGGEDVTDFGNSVSSVVMVPFLCQPDRATGCVCEGVPGSDRHWNRYTEDSRWPSSVWVDLLQTAEGLKRRERPRERDVSLATYRAKTSAFHCLQHQIPCFVQMRSCEKCAPTFLAPIFREKNLSF